MTAMKAAFVGPVLSLGLALTAALSLTGCHGEPKQVAEPAAVPAAKIVDEASKEIPSDL